MAVEVGGVGGGGGGCRCGALAFPGDAHLTPASPIDHPHRLTTAALHPDIDPLTTPLPTLTTATPTKSPPTPLTVIPPSSVHPPPSLSIPCLLRPCPGPLFFASASALAQHLRSNHRPLTDIPSTALVPHLFRCKFCLDAIYSSPATLASRARACARAPPAAPSPTVATTDPTDPYATTDFTTAATHDPSAHDAPPSHALTANLQFLTFIPPDSALLHEVHSAALPTIPTAAAAAIDAIYIVALNALLSDVTNDAACSLFYAIPRLLLFPPPPPNSAPPSRPPSPPVPATSASAVPLASGTPTTGTPHTHIHTHTHTHTHIHTHTHT